MPAFFLNYNIEYARSAGQMLTGLVMCPHPSQLICWQWSPMKRQMQTNPLHEEQAVTSLDTYAACASLIPGQQVVGLKESPKPGALT